MKGEERVREITDSLRLLVRKGRSGDSFVVFDDPRTKKFVQFSLCEEGLLCDVPLIELTKDEEDRVKQVIGEREAAIDPVTGEVVSYRRRLKRSEVDRAAEITEKIFMEVFRLPESYKLRCELDL